MSISIFIDNEYIYEYDDFQSIADIEITEPSTDKIFNQHLIIGQRLLNGMIKFAGSLRCGSPFSAH